LGGRAGRGAVGAAGWRTYEGAFVGRPGGGYLDVGGLVGITKALVARDTRRYIYEATTSLLPGPNQTLRAPGEP
jgi:hypothetical protein